MRRRWALVAVWVSPLVIAIAVLAYTAHSQAVDDQRQRSTDHKFCALLTSLDSPQAPATTSRGLVVQQQIHALRLSLGCGS